MKLRNKKTGEIAIVESISDYQTDDGTEIGFRVKNTLNYYSYPTLAALNEEWEDYSKLKEPLIEDKDIRNAVRAIGEVYKGEPLRFNRWGRSFDIYDVSGNIGASICFNTTELGLTNVKEYTIDELCGEEEE